MWIISLNSDGGSRKRSEGASDKGMRGEGVGKPCSIMNCRSTFWLSRRLGITVLACQTQRDGKKNPKTHKNAKSRKTLFRLTTATLLQNMKFPLSGGQVGRCLTRTDSAPRDLHPSLFIFGVIPSHRYTLTLCLPTLDHHYRRHT